MAVEVERLVATLEARIDKYEKNLAKAAGTTDKQFSRIERRGKEMEIRLSRIGSSLASSFKGFLGGLAAGAGLASVEGLARALRGAVKEAADLVDLSQKIGVNTDDLQRLVFGFSQAGVDAETTAKSLSQWGRRIGEAYTQGGPLAELFKANNLSLTDGEGRLRSSVDLLGDMANLIKNAGSEQERLALAQIAFGKAGDDMVLALKDGADGMRDLMRATDEAGGVLDKEVLARIAEVDDELDKISRRIELGLKEGMLSVALAIVDVINVAKQLGDELEHISGIPGPTWLSGLLGGVIPTGGGAGGISRIGDVLANQPPPLAEKGGGAFREGQFDLNSPSASGQMQKLSNAAQEATRRASSTIIPNFGGGGGGGGGSRRSVEKDDPWEGLRESAHDYGKELEDILRQQEEIGDSVGNFAGQLVNAFKDGKLEAEELLSIVADLAVQLLKMPSIGGSGFGGGFLSSLLSSVFHQGGVVGQGGTQRAVSPLAFAGAPRMHSGGVAGLRAGEVPAILQRGEVVLPRGSRMGGSGGGNVHVTVGVDVDRSGNLVPFVTNIAQGEAGKASSRLGKDVPKMVDSRNNTARNRKTRA